jgi:subtilisin family serine protease
VPFVCFVSLVFDRMYLDEYTGKRVRVAVIDSGVHPTHPHVGGIAGGFGIGPDGTLTDECVDRLGHGTAVAAAIREKAAGAELIAVKVFWQSLATDIESLCVAILRAAESGAQVINLSLGTNQAQHRTRLQNVVAAARDRGAILVAANDDAGARWFPGSLDGVVAVRADWMLDRHRYAVAAVEGRELMLASPYPRDIPGVPREKNVHGVSFAVANASGFVARAIEAHPGAGLDEVRAALREAACSAHPA